MLVAERPVQVTYNDEGMEALIFTADGDMRQALNNLQVGRRTRTTIRMTRGLLAGMDKPLVRGSLVKTPVFGCACCRRFWLANLVCILFVCGV
jgi:hypothetical protein